MIYLFYESLVSKITVMFKFTENQPQAASVQGET